MNPLQSDILKTVARLACGVRLGSPHLDLLVGVCEPVPMLYVLIEHWSLLAPSSVSADRARLGAFRRSWDELTREGFIEPLGSTFHPQIGVVPYEAQDGSEWHIETNTLGLVYSNDPSWPPWPVLAAPCGLIDKLRQELRSERLHVAAWPFITEYGIACFDASKHPCFGISPKGWDKSGLAAEDFADHPQPANEEATHVLPTTSPGKKPETVAVGGEEQGAESEDIAGDVHELSDDERKQLEAIPELKKGSGEWITQVAAAREGRARKYNVSNEKLLAEEAKKAVRALKSARRPDRAQAIAPDETVGIDQMGRYFRIDPTDRKIFWYYKPTTDDKKV